MPRVPDEHLEAKRKIILHAAIACFARDGFHKTKMSDIAEMAGVSDGLAYRYFSGKEEIIREAVQMATGPGESLDLEDEDVDSMIDLVSGIGFQRFDMAGRKTTVGLRMRSWSEALEDEAVREQVIARWNKHVPVDEKVWSRAQAEGLVSDDLDPKAIALVMMALHDGLDLLWALHPRVDIEGCRDVVVAMVRGDFRVDGE